MRHNLPYFRHHNMVEKLRLSSILIKKHNFGFIQQASYYQCSKIDIKNQDFPNFFLAMGHFPKVMVPNILTDLNSFWDYFVSSQISFVILQFYQNLYKGFSHYSQRRVIASACAGTHKSKFMCAIYCTHEIKVFSRFVIIIYFLSAEIFH